MQYNRQFHTLTAGGEGNAQIPFFVRKWELDSMILIRKNKFHSFFVKFLQVQYKNDVFESYPPIPLFVRKWELEAMILIRKKKYIVFLFNFYKYNVKTTFLKVTLPQQFILKTIPSPPPTMLMIFNYFFGHTIRTFWNGSSSFWHKNWK